MAHQSLGPNQLGNGVMWLWEGPIQEWRTWWWQWSPIPLWLTRLTCYHGWCLQIFGWVFNREASKHPGQTTIVLLYSYFQPRWQYLDPQKSFWSNVLQHFLSFLLTIPSFQPTIPLPFHPAGPCVPKEDDVSFSPAMDESKDAQSSCAKACPSVTWNSSWTSIVWHVRSTLQGLQPVRPVVVSTRLCEIGPSSLLMVEWFLS